uniref:DNA ligase 4-like n=1 Tax=Styela clava TaxID=7725 RepID=UPI00193981BE|nr:DNA ligase 4-like [Styela clava]
MTTPVAVDTTVASKVPFGQLCQLFERISRGKSNPVRREEFRNFVKKWREHHEKLHSKIITNGSIPDDSFYPAFRLIAPQLDRERPSYGVKETLLAKLYIDVLGLSRTNPDAKKLLEYKNPKTNTLATGDFAEIAYIHILSKRCTTQGSLSIQQVNDNLDKLAMYNGERKKEQVQKTLMTLIQKTSASEQKWLIRILLKDTRLKIGQSVLMAEFHPDAEEVFNVTTNLRQVCMKLIDPSIRLSDTEIELFQPFRPMLALNAKLTEVENLMDHKPFYLEIKYDGERSQIHKEGLKYKYFSRSGREYSTVFGEDPYSGSLTPFIHDLFTPNVRSCILDGEMMGYDPGLNLFMQKGGQFDIKHVTEDHDLQPCFVAYDLLSLNGENLTSKPVAERMKKLESIFKPLEGRMQLAERKQVSTNQETLAYLNEAIDRREEGIIVKHPQAPYTPNKRKGSGWFKIKPEYVSGVVDDLDLVIVGGKFGDGRHGKLISKFMLAVRDDKSPNLIYKSLCMVGSGYTDKELSEITEKLKPHLRVFEKRKPPPWLIVTKEKPEVVVHPDNSVVVQVRATEITESTAYAAGCTLRFPRIVGTRDDKNAADAMDVTQLTELRNMAQGKLAARHATLTKEPSVKKRKIRVEPSAVVSARFQATNVMDVEQTSNSFEDFEFCVMSGVANNNKSSLEKKIASHGGSIVQNPSSETYCVIARDEKNVRVRNIIRSGKHDVVKVSWLLLCLEKGEIVPFMPEDMLFTSEKTKLKFADKFDKYGDEYTEDIDVEKLKQLFSKVENTEGYSSHFPPPDADDRLTVMQCCANDVSSRYHSYGFHDLKTSIFQGFHFYINDCLVVNDLTTQLKTSKWKEARSVSRFFSAILDDTISEKTTHVISDELSETIGNIDEIKNIRRSSKTKFHLVSIDWLFQCVKNGKVESERPYEI